MENPRKRNAPKTNLINSDYINFTLGLIAVLFLIFTTYTPNLKTFDSNVPKFLSLILINLFSVVTLIVIYPRYLHSEFFIKFFKTKIGITYSVFIIISLFSTFIALNKPEAIIQFIRIIAVFCSVYIFTLLFKSNQQYIKWLFYILVAILVIDSISVFYYINEYISGRIEHINDIKTIYSNKNILASAIFLKLPAALWIIQVENEKIKLIGWLGLFMGITALLFLAARAFYLGVIIVAILFLSYLLISYFKTKSKSNIFKGIVFILTLVAAYLLFTGTQYAAYPTRDDSRFTKGVAEQISLINVSESTAHKRIIAWENSWKIFKENPILGVGIGNWKIEVLKYENKNNPDYALLRRAHNDFLQLFAETGVIGGLLYIGIFLLVIYNFFTSFLSQKESESRLSQYLFIATLGIICYSIDAFFNFPLDRPEIQIIFSFYLAIILIVSITLNRKPSDDNNPIRDNRGINLFINSVVAVVITLLLGSAYIGSLNFKSSKTQRIVMEEIAKQELTTKSDIIMAGFPCIPNINALGEPIKVQIARYLIEEDKNEEAINILSNENSSPWDGRREYFMSVAFNNLNQVDSAIKYSDIMHNIKPLYFKNLILLCNLYDKKGEYDVISEYLDSYLAKIIDNNMAWIYTTRFYDRIGNSEKAWNTINLAKKYLPNDTLIGSQYNFLYRKQNTHLVDNHLNKANESFLNENYVEALSGINEYIKLTPGNFKAHQLRAFIYYYLKEYDKCIEEINYAITLKGNYAAIYNLRGASYRTLNQMDKACQDFYRSWKLGDSSGKTNYEKYCK